MPHWVAGIDVHKRMLAVVIADVMAEREYAFVHRRVGTSPGELRRLAAWLVAQEVEEVVMESTAPYWRPVWETLERDWTPRRTQRAGAGPLSGALHAQVRRLDQQMACLLGPYQAAVLRYGRRAGTGRGLGAADHRRGGGEGGDVSLAQTTRVLGGGLSWECRECGHQLQSPLAEGPSTDASPAQPSGQRGGQDQGEYFPAGLSAAGSASGPRASHWGDCASAVWGHLADSAPGRPVRGAWPGGQPHADETTGREDDPGTAQPRLSSRVGTIAVRHDRMRGSVFRLWFEELRERVPTE